MNTARIAAQLALRIVAIGGLACVFGLRADSRSEADVAPDVTVVDDTGQQAALSAVLQAKGGGPVIVLPIYTRCAASCPVLTRKLETETAEINHGSFRVLLFSFDPGETTESLRVFRERERVPANWTVVRAEEAQIRRFVDFFHFSVMTQGGTLLHPNELFLLDPQFRWRATLIDQEWNRRSLQKLLQRIEAPGLLGWVVLNPARAAIAGFTALLTSFAFLMLWLAFRRPQQRPAAN